jgi:hypothetical protein
MTAPEPEPDCWLHPDAKVRQSPISVHNIDTITVDADLHLVLPPPQPGGYGNHSCDPNPLPRHHHRRRLAPPGPAYAIRPALGARSAGPHRLG